MGKLTIIGNDKPVIGKQEMYSVTTINGWLNPLQPIKNPLQVPKPHWEVMVQTKTGWRKGGSDKEGQMVPYIFGQKSLFHKGIKIIVRQGEDYGELIVHPQRAKEPKITRVELLDANYKPIPKGKKLSYKDTIIARAYCVEMFGMNIAFTLWEDDAQGEGHNPTVNAFNKINPVPVLSRVNEKGMAEAVFRLPFYTMAVLIANARTASGDKNEGSTHEYYVTADVVSKHIQKASPNVNVVNPTYNPEPPRKREVPKKQTPSTPKPKTTPAPEKPKPKPDSPKFPITTGGKKSDDPQGKILSAEFVDKVGNRLHSSKVGTTVFMKITAKDMKNKKVKVKIWEEDNIKWTNDKIFEQDYELLYDTNFIWIVLTKKMFIEGNDGGSDSAKQDYFIEVIHNDTSVTSAVMPVSADATPTEVPSGNSATMVKEPKQGKTPTSCICKEQYKDLIWGEKVSCEFRKKVVEIAKELWLNDYKNMSNNLMAIIALETNKTFDPKTSNKNGYFGLIGFGAPVIADFQRTLDKSITKQKILACTAVEQLYYVKERFKFVQKHLMNNGKGGILTDFTDLYLAVLYPAKSGLLSGEDVKYKVIFDASKGKKYELEYRQNPSFMKEENEFETKQKVTFTRNGKEVTEVLRGFSDLSKAKTYRWEVTEQIEKFKKEGDSYKVTTFSCNKENSDNKEIEKRSDWHNPVDDPQLCLYTQNGNYRPRYNVFGKVRKERTKLNHQGIDFLVLPGSNAYACVDAYVEFIEEQTGYGNVICLKVKDKEAFLKRKRNFNLVYSSEGEMLEGPGFKYNGDFYLFYAHLQKINIPRDTKEVKCGIVIGLNGTSGYGSTHDPHLHFEIRSEARASGLNSRCHPGIFVYYKGENDMSQSEKDYHKTIAKKAWD